MASTRLRKFGGFQHGELDVEDAQVHRDVVERVRPPAVWKPSLAVGDIRAGQREVRYFRQAPERIIHQPVALHRDGLRSPRSGWLEKLGLAPLWPRISDNPQDGAAGFAAAARAFLRLARKYFTPSMVRKAVTTAIRMGAVCSAPTWVKNAAISTMEKGVSSRHDAVQKATAIGLLGA
jgi:hypothetical protein